MMDTSEQYIKMCEKAEEIQALFDEWDDDVILVCSVCRTRYGNCISHPVESGKNELDHTMIKLPRQDQLQEMYLSSMPDGTYTKIFTLLESFYGHFEQYGYPSYAFSMEQLWLAFVMKEKYNKTWDGSSWIST